MRTTLLFLCSVAAFGATGDVTAVSIVKDTCTAGISCNGWVAEISLEGLSTGGTYSLGLGASNDPSTAKIVFTVTSPGYDTTGSLTTITRSVYGTAALRKPYPNEATKDETAGTPLVVRVALSDFIYSGDTATYAIAAGFYTGSLAGSGTATVNSTLAYPKPVGRWAWVPYTRETGDFLLESTVFHRFARNGKPLAALKYSCSDAHSNTVTATVNSMTVSTRTGDANKVLVYASTIPVTSLTQGDVITCNFTAYPWVGDATALLNSDLVANGGDGVAQPDERLGPFAILLDKTGGYGGAAAVVDSVNGRASALATWTYASQAAAEAAYAGDHTLSYSAIGYASAACKAYNNANKGHNDPGGCTIILATGTNALPGAGALGSSVAQSAWTEIVSITGGGGAISSSDLTTINIQRLKISGIPIAVSTNGIRGVNTSDALWLDSNTLNITGSAAPYIWKQAYATRNTITALANGFQAYSVQKCPYSLVRGNTGPTGAASVGILASFHAVLGNRNLMPAFIATGNGWSEQISDNAIAAFNTIYGMSATWVQMDAATVITSGVAYVQNVIESVSSSASYRNDIENANTNNVLIWHNTIPGPKILVGYNSSGSTTRYHQNWSFKGNLISDYNTKHDLFAPQNGARTGGWPINYSVGFVGNYQRASNDPTWYGDFSGLWNIHATGNMGFVHDYSYDDPYPAGSSSGGSGAGNGDYHLTASSSALRLIPAGGAILPYDLEGKPRLNGGNGSAGAYEAGGGTVRHAVIQ